MVHGNAGQRAVQRQSSWQWTLLVVVLSFVFTGCTTGGQTTTGSGQPTIAPTPTSTVSATATPTATPAPVHTIQRGMIYPRWHPDSYGIADTTWQQGIQDIKTQTAATWLEIPILFTQSTPYSTDVGPGSSTPSVDAFANGIQNAHSLGYKVFFVPLSGVNTPGGWAGIIQFGTEAQEQTWFDNYWNTLKPYAIAAQNNNVEQMSIGTELQWLQDNATASLWEELITRVRSVFKGTLTYDMNWPALSNPPQSWLKNPELAMIGVSVYIPLVDSPVRVDPKDIPALWKQRVRKLLDAFSAQIGKHLLINEIGYRNSWDTLFNPWYSQSSAPDDQEEQAGAFDAALSNIFADNLIDGVYFWGWDDVGRLGIKGQSSAIQVIYKWYSSK